MADVPGSEDVNSSQQSYNLPPQFSNEPDVRTMASIKATLSKKAEELVKAGQPYVMTSLGPIPLPDNVRNQIPEKFVAAPVLEEREVIVARREVQERIIEVPQIQYEHKFVEVPQKVVVEKIIPIPKDVVREVEIPRYTATVEEKVIEVPQGVKFVEVPVEVPIAYPPRIVPVPKPYIVERTVELSRPVIEERLLEVPQKVYRQVPYYKDVEVPFVVPRYVEKLVEVPFHPGMMYDENILNQSVPPIPPQSQQPFMIPGTAPTSAPLLSMPQPMYAPNDPNEVASDGLPSHPAIPPYHMLPKNQPGSIPQMIPLANSYAAFPLPQGVNMTNHMLNAGNAAHIPGKTPIPFNPPQQQNLVTGMNLNQVNYPSNPRQQYPYHYPPRQQ
ncbi:articulin family [Cryptosporidium xiaoi]|uniref:Articulin family n=1 Tax=Cryptosporidium xiaoi TaxID=659607 RepID=A0AAV9Y240_9CRYT